MKQPSPLSHDIAIVGLGMVGVHQMTAEVVETISRSNHLFVTDLEVGVADHLRTLCPKVTDLTSRRETGSHRIQIYRRMASEVVAAALEESPVCFASYGHPTLYCYPSVLIQRAAQILDLRTLVLAGVSSLDLLMTELGLDPGADGLQVFEASDMLIRHRPVQPDMGCVIYQAPIVVEAFNRVPDAGRGDDLRRFQDYLLEFYPAQHTALFVTLKTHPLLETITQKIPIGRLAETLLGTALMGTMYIPPTHHREVADKALAARMTLREDEAPPARRPGRPEIGPKADAPPR